MCEDGVRDVFLFMCVMVMLKDEKQKEEWQHLLEKALALQSEPPKPLPPDKVHHFFLYHLFL